MKIFSHKYGHFLFQICRSKIVDVENLFYIHHIFESLQPPGCSWRVYATQEADQELQWKLRTLSVWEIQVLVFLGPQSWDTRRGEKPASNRVKGYLQIFSMSEVWGITTTGSMNCELLTYLLFRTIALSKKSKHIFS